MDTIRELFYGNIHPYERDIPKGSDCDKLNKLIIRHDAALKATLNKQENSFLLPEVTDVFCLYDASFSFIILNSQQIFYEKYCFFTDIMIY